MKNLIHHAFLVGTLTLNACATLPPAPAPVPVPVPSAAKSQNTQNSFPGYRRVVVKGEERFCRSDPQPGSRIQQGMVCYTAEQIEQNERNSREFLNNVESQTGLGGMPQQQLGAAGR